MYVLSINDDNGQTRSWWYNFLSSLGSNGTHDLGKEFAKYNAKIVLSDSTPFNDTIEFDSEEDLIWFLLKWE